MSLAKLMLAGGNPWKLLNWDMNLKQAMLRGAAAKAMGLPAEPFAMPYPAESSVVVNETSSPVAVKPASRWGWLVGAAVVAVASIAYGLWQQKGPAPVPTAPSGSSVPAAVAPAPSAAEFWQIDQVQQPDGSWQETGRRKVRLNPDGSVTTVKE